MIWRQFDDQNEKYQRANYWPIFLLTFYRTRCNSILEWLVKFDRESIRADRKNVVLSMVSLNKREPEKRSPSKLIVHNSTWFVPGVVEYLKSAIRLRSIVPSIAAEKNGTMQTRFSFFWKSTDIFAREIRLTREIRFSTEGKWRRETVFQGAFGFARHEAEEKIMKPGRTTYRNGKNFKTRCVTPRDT